MSLSQLQGTVWFDGKFVPSQAATISFLTHSLHYGTGVFEGVRAYQTEQGTAIFRLDAHTDRLFKSARMLNIDMPFDKATINQAQQQLLQENKLASAYLRPIVFYGAEHLAVHTQNIETHTAIAAWEWGQYFKTDAANQGIKAHISTYARNHVNSVLCKAKACGNYINATLALQEAKARGCSEALMLDTRGYVSEGSSSNVFIVRNGVLYTPQTETILEGITRDSVIKLANYLAIDVVEKNLTRDDIYVADEMFFTGTAAEITPVGEIDGRTIGDGSPGPMTEKLSAAFQQTTQGKLPEFAHWLAFT